MSMSDDKHTFDKVAFALRLQHAIIATGFTLPYVAKALGYSSHATIENWIFGRAEPSREAIYNLAKLLGTTPMFLEFGVEKETVH